ncbi:4-oxalocrotonate tautomerase family protein [Paraburkholderia acidicola]
MHPAQTAETTERSRIMPFVSIRITREGVTAEQKAQVIKEVTDTLERVLHKPPEWTHIVIEEVDTDNWGFGGRTTTAIRKEQAG